MRYDAILFDLDGTLVDSLPDIATALNHALGRFGLPPVSPAVVRTLVGDGIVSLVTKALAVTPGGAAHDAASVAEAARTYYLAHAAEATRPYPEIVETLAALRSGASRRLAVLTNKPGDVARKLLAELELASAFDAVVGDMDGFPRKPDPAAAHALLARFGVSIDRALVVGDGLPDLAVAHAAGCHVAAAGWGYTDRPALMAERPTYYVDRPADLLALV